MEKFTWIPIYEELASKLLDWEGRQAELVQILIELDKAGVPVGSVNDESAQGKFPLAEIDPFTFFAAFNRQVTNENRQTILARIKERLSLKSPVPEDFHGIPVANNMRAWFFPYAKKRQRGDIAALWTLARQAVTKGLEGIDAATFDRCLDVENVGMSKLTMGLFWMRPRQFLPLDGSTRDALKEADVVSNARNFADYVDVLKRTKAVEPDFPKLSASAYHAAAEPVPVAQEPAPTFAVSSEADARVEPLNLILYGPPGTGKTYRIQQMAKALKASRPSEASTLDEFSWFEVIAAALHDLGGRAAVPKLIQHRFLLEKHRRAGIRTELGNITWAQLQQHTVKDSRTVDYARRAGALVFDRDADGAWHFAAGKAPDEIREVHRQLVTAPSAETTERDRFQLVTFHQSFSYEDFVEGIRPVLSREDDAELRYELKEGVFLRACEEAVRVARYEHGLSKLCLEPAERRVELFRGAPTYALFIDEINRGNVSRIFGELISLIEPSKRLGAEDEMIVTLPYSRRRFGVPPNLRLVGAMNTADRSIEALDTALRRRFDFEHLTPNADELEGLVIEGVEIASVLRAINARLRTLLDPGHAIGHAYFWPLKKGPTFDHLKRIFGRKVLPLLEEYFHSEPRNLGLVLGPSFVASEKGARLFGREDDLMQTELVRVRDVNELGPEAFKSIYGTA